LLLASVESQGDLDTRSVLKWALMGYLCRAASIDFEIGFKVPGGLFS